VKSEKHERLRRLSYCFGFFFLAEFLLFTLMILAGRSRPYSGEHFLLYWLVGPLGAWLERYSLLSDFRFLVFVVAFLANPLLYGLALYLLVSLGDYLNRKNEVPSIKSQQ
jgi:hypothetical protein